MSLAASSITTDTYPVLRVVPISFLTPNLNLTVSPSKPVISTVYSERYALSSIAVASI